MIVIGKIREITHNATDPSIFDSISDDEMIDKPNLINYLRNGKITACSPEIVRDVVTGERIACPLRMMTDGVYAWRSDVIYYVEKYNMRLPEEFIAHIRVGR